MTDLREQTGAAQPHGSNGEVVPGRGASAGGASAGDDPLARLHKMSTTAGLGTTDYVAINPTAVVSIFLGFASLLALLDNLLLAIPVVAIICSIWALTQIAKSGGTQSGRSLAIAGLLLAFGCFALVGGRSWVNASRVRNDEQKTIALVGELNDLVMSGKYDQAYNLMGDKFKERVKLWDWQQRWQRFRDVQKLTKIESNRRVDFETQPNTGEVLARSFVIPQFNGQPGYDRLDIYFRKSADGPWQINDLPAFFPAEQGPRRGSQQPSQQQAPGR